MERARIVALSWDGLRVRQIADRIGCHAKKVRRWLHRFNAAGVDGLGNRPGVGRKRVYQRNRAIGDHRAGTLDPTGPVAS
ncbi:helix-turn-helix domain-containing protein [Nocardia terpenica]|uniref:helix-turn-helix domain-containing protein n=1 Tax=Nocardia terpenica TaxID=455432 RepID=UPI002FE376BD